MIFSLRILAFALAVPRRLRMKLPELDDWLSREGMLLEVVPAGVERIVTCVDTVLRVGSPLVRRGCLTRGLTLFYFLRRAGLEVSLCFGVGKREDEFVGHCWLVREGEPFLESKDPRSLYTVLYTIPRLRRTPADPGQMPGEWTS